MINLYNTDQYVIVTYDDFYNEDQKVIIKNGVFFSSITGMDRREHYDSFGNEISVGDIVILKPEPDNPADPDAIAVFWNEFKIGYIPRKHIPVVMPCIDDEGTAATIDKITDRFVGIQVKATFKNLGKRKLDYETVLVFDIKEDGNTVFFTDKSFNEHLYYSEGEDSAEFEGPVTSQQVIHTDGFEWYDPNYRRTHSMKDFMSEYGLNMENIFDYSFYNDDNYLYFFLMVNDLLNQPKVPKDSLINDSFFLCRKNDDCLELYKPDDTNNEIYHAYINNDISPFDENYIAEMTQNKIINYAMCYPENCIFKLVDYHNIELFSSVISKMFFRVILPNSPELVSYLSSDEGSYDDSEFDSDFDDCMFDD